MKLHIQKAQTDGQALVVVLIMAVISVSITAAATMVITSASQGTRMSAFMNESLLVAESGAESAILALARSPSYTGETLAIGDVSALISVSSPTASTRIITSTATVGSVKQVVEVQGSFSQSVFTVTSWKQMNLDTGGI